ncbi:MAG TPA: pyruvate formate-lyase-activating protein [Azospirillum sp.]|nr:pyruvate formate-lyase-activating protein [Azospirillum sp.]
MRCEPNGALCLVPHPHLSRPERLTGWIHSVETAGTVDGPGVRFVLFTAGCPLRCLYCHNPDSQHMKEGHQVSIEQVLDEIASYADMLKRMHGGLTISGGEPLVQPEFTAAILRGAKELGLHTALDTSGYLGARASGGLLADTDLVLLDVKHIDPDTYRRLTGVELQPTLDFARHLDALGKPMWIRYVLVPGLTDQPDAVERLADFVASLGSVERVDVLPFHKMGEYKWFERDLRYELADVQPPTPEAAEAVRGVFRSRGLFVD